MNRVLSIHPIRNESVEVPTLPNVCEESYNICIATIILNLIE